MCFLFGLSSPHGYNPHVQDDFPRLSYLLKYITYIISSTINTSFTDKFSYMYMS